MTGLSRAREFPFQEARKIIQHLAKPNPIVYWIDLLLSAGAGWTAFVFALHPAVPLSVSVVLALVSSLALYRATIFIHELAHLRRGTFKSFRIVWNLFVGFPIMLPSFAYKGVHTEHHVKSIYGTHEDGEYWPFVHTAKYQIWGFPIVSLLLPIYFAFRFIVLTPLLPFSRAFRKAVWEWVSSLAIIARYRRPLPDSKKERINWIVQEWFTCAYGVTAIVLVILQLIPYEALILWYCVSSLAFFLNALRTLAAHCYRNEGDAPMSESEQLLDSVNVPGPLSALWAPVGLRFHATHHLFMLMPYHRLGKAHRRLMKELPETSPYRETVRGSLFGALARLWSETGAARTGTTAAGTDKRGTGGSKSAGPPAGDGSDDTQQ